MHPDDCLTRVKSAGSEREVQQIERASELLLLRISENEMSNTTREPQSVSAGHLQYNRCRMFQLGFKAVLE